MGTILKIITAVVVRLVLLLHVFLAYWKASDLMLDKSRWLFTVFVTFQILEGVYSISFRKGCEYKWFCPCFFFYFISVAPAIWILEVDRLEKYDYLYNNVNGAVVESSLSGIEGITIPLTLTPDVWVALIEQSLLFLIILSRWFLPRGSMTKDELSQLLFIYLSIASDNLELFSLFDEAPIRKERTLTLIILATWTFSLIQFSVVFIARRDDPDSEDNRTQRKEVKKGIFTTDIWALCVMFVLADGPYLAVRLYCMINFSLITYSIIFFTFKNILVISLFFYRIIVVFCCSGNDKENVQRFDGDIRKKPLNNMNKVDSF